MFLQRHTRERATRPRLLREAVVIMSAAMAVALTACSHDRAAGQPGESSQPPVPVASGVGDDTDDSAPAATDQDATGATGAETTEPSGQQPPAAPIANAVTIDMPGMSYQVSGQLRPGIAAITLVNSDDVAHMMAVGRMKDGVTIKQITKALDESEDAAVALLADPPDTAYGTPSLLGAGQSTTVTAKDLPAGHYALICFLAGADGTPHFKMGMIGELTVAGDKATQAPTSDGTITIDDKAVTLPDGFTGSGTFEVVNKGNAPHAFSLAKLDTGTTLVDFATHVGMAENAGEPIDGGGGVLAGGIDALGPSGSAYLTLHLRSGHYGYVSPEDMTGPQLPAQAGEFDVR